ncbi:AMP-dependent synthetase/ligase [Desulfosporosinus hippei]|uniref:AMP-dependent synthetase/ligase n=1 Tax=Desulfosporosinus hippei TaxID=569859 RepID=UPI00249F5F85|nr:AMP-binding protein [Desulfosporosinus hippei]
MSRQHLGEDYAKRIAFRYKEKGLEIKRTYQDLYDDVQFLGISLLNLGVKNLKVAVIGENIYEWIVTYLATVNSGNVIVPLDKELGPKEIAGILSETEAGALVYSPQYQEIAQAAIKALDRDLILIETEKDPQTTNSLSFWQLIDQGKKYMLEGNPDFASLKLDRDQLAAINYTSGTTGLSKGVMLTHKNLISNTIGALNNVQVYTTSLLILPIHHTFGFTAGVLSMLHAGTCICINSSQKKLAGDLQDYKPEHLFLVPLYVETLYKKIWQIAKSTQKEKLLRKVCRLSDTLLAVGIDLRKILFRNVLAAFGGELKLIVCGGAPLDPKYVKGFRSFGINVLNGYGITECSPIVAVNRNEYYRDGSVGTVLSCCRVKLHNLNEDGEGEILVSGDCVMKGYFKNEQETDRAFLDGWFRTGDIGKLDADGFLFITGRTKNIIIFSNGKNIYPEELEMLLMNIPSVNEALVYAERNQADQELYIVAEVYLAEEYREGQPLENIKQELAEEIKLLNKSLPAYKNISEFRIRQTEFEKTTTKKIIRK